jgi:hypothetical protein
VEVQRRAETECEKFFQHFYDMLAGGNNNNKKAGTWNFEVSNPWYAFFMLIITRPLMTIRQSDIVCTQTLLLTLTF